MAIEQIVGLSSEWPTYALYALPLALGAGYIYLSRLRTEHLDLPQPGPNNVLIGHMKYVGEAVAAGKPGQHIDEIFCNMLAQAKSDILFLDFRPLKYKMIININGPLAEHFTKASPDLPYGLRRSKTTHDLDDILGTDSIFSSHSEHWKGLRKRYNPGFQARHLWSLVPDMVKEMEYCILAIGKRAEENNGIVQLFDPLTRFSFDVIGIVALEESLGAQRGDSKGLGSDVFNTFEKLKEQYYIEGPNGWRPDTFVNKKLLGWKLSKQISRIIQDKQERAAVSQPRSIIGLTLNTDPKPSLASSIAQMKTFLFAGHDTTSSTICWAIYEITRRPSVLAAAEDEMRKVFNFEASMTTREKQAAIAEALSDRPEATVNALVYLEAITKETLRLWSPVSSIRMNNFNDPFTFAYNNQSHTITAPTLIYSVSTGIHKHARWGSDAEEFRPERWIGTEFAEKTSKIVAEGWYRPFEKGPRHCIGQQMALIEMKIALCLLIVSYTFEAREEDMEGKKLGWRIIGIPADGMKLKVTARE